MSDTPASALQIPSFTKHYGDHCVLDFPGLSLQSGMIYGIIGANGSGKSTFAKILAGTLAADQQLSFTGNLSAAASLSVGYMPQKSFAFRMSTLANVCLGNHDPEKAMRMLRALHLQDLADKRADHLSGGETARMALARIMMKSFDLVILDEPTASMDMETTLISEHLLKDYVQETGCALILITHNLAQARRLTDELMFFRDGKLLEHGPANQVLDHPSVPETRHFLEFFAL